MAEENENKESEEKASGSAKPLLKWIVLAGLVVVLGTGGFFGWRMFFAKSDAEAAADAQVAEHKPQKEEIETRIVFPLESFVVNLVDKAGMGKRYLKTTIELEVGDEAGKEKVTGYQAQLRDTILMLLTSQTFKEISSIEGKLDLKQALLARINQTMGEGIVRRIYFTEFVVQ